MILENTFSLNHSTWQKTILLAGVTAAKKMLVKDWKTAVMPSASVFYLSSPGASCPLCIQEMLYDLSGSKYCVNKYFDMHG